MVGTDLAGVRATAHEVMRDSRGHFLFPATIHVTQHTRRPLMQASTPDSGNAVVEMADQQWMPEMIGDVNTGAFLCQYARLQRLFQQIQHNIFIGISTICLHCMQQSEFKRATEHSCIL